MKKLKQIKNYLLAFLIPFFLCLLIFYFKDVLNNIENIYISDLRMQHLIFFNFLKNSLTGDSSILYSFYAGIGSPMISTVIFYCISPINFLLLVIKDIRYAILFIYFVKLSLAGLTMFILLKSKKNTDRDFITIIFSSCYALCAFAINYFFCIFWFDVLYLAPLVMLGIDKIIKNERINLLYIISLTVAIICNIQMGFGLCIYSVIYYLYSFNINYDIKGDLKKFKQLTFIFIISSLCAGAISSGAILGFASAYKNISTARDIVVDTSAGVSHLGFILKNLFTVGNFKEDYYNNFEPFTYCGLIVSFFSILYFFNKDINRKKKVNALIVISIFAISFCVNFINLFWHLSSPVLLNYRYSVYLGLFLTMLAYESYLTKEHFVKKDIIVLSISLLVAFFLLVGFSNEAYVVWSFVFLILVFVLIILVKTKTKKFEVLLLLTVVSEIFTNGYLSIYTSNDIDGGKYTSYNSLKKLGKLNDFDDAYRVMYNYSYTDFMNDAFLLNQDSSLRYFSSVIDGDILNFFDRNYAVVGNNNYRVSAYESPLLLSLMGAKYFYLTTDFDNSIYKKIDSYQIDSYNYMLKDTETRDVYLYENPYALSLGYVIENDVSHVKDMNSVDYQNAIIRAFTGNNDDVLVKLDYVSMDDSDECNQKVFDFCRTFEIKNNTNNILTYVYSPFERYVVPKNHKVYIDVDKPILLSAIGSNVRLTLEASYEVLDEHFFAVTYNESNLINSLSSLQENMIKNVKIDGNVLTGEISSSKNGILFLSIPYDENFKIYVDGKEMDYYPVLDNSFIGLDIEAGEYDIKVKYVDSKLKWYIIISFSSLVITLVLYYFINKSIRKKQEEEKKLQEQLEKQLSNKKSKKEKKKVSNKKSKK